MTNPPFTQDYLKAILDYNPDTGIFTWKWRVGVPKGVNSRWVGKPCTNRSQKGYIRIVIDHAHYRGHVLAWFYMKGEWRPTEIDHENKDPADNRINNLRLADNSQQQSNRGRQSNNKSGYKGVSWSATMKKWHAQITLRKTYYDLGYYDDKETAYEVYCKWGKRLHGEFFREV